MAARRSSELDLCFDSMTDLITNLAGGLILIVLLVLGLTQPAPPPGSVSVRQLYDQANEIQLEAEHLNQQLRQSEQQLDVLRQETEDLERKCARWSSDI